MPLREEITTPVLLMTEGKLISQMVAYIWLWADYKKDNNEIEDETKRQKHYDALLLKYCFDRRHNKNATVHNTYKGKIPQSPFALEILLTVDAKKYLDALKDNNQKDLGDFNDDERLLAQLLINVFGEERVKYLQNYLSPIFDPEEVYMGNDDDNGVQGLLPIYKFQVNTDNFVGYLKDPDLEDRLMFRYMISYPPCPKLSKATLTERELKVWIENTEETKFRPATPFLPVTTS